MNGPAIAIVGSGPSGCYLAQALRKHWPESEISVLDRAPVPFGLIRYGVAPDHTGTKAVVRQFERLFTRESVRFVGNVSVGQDISLAELRAAFDIVVLASGLSGDRLLSIPGESLPGVYRAGPLTRFFNDHPDEQASHYDLGKHCVIIGNGNVALDLLRLISKPAEAFAGSEVSASTLNRINRDALQRIDIVGRSPLTAAKFDTVMLKELLAFSHINTVVHLSEQALQDGGPRGEVLQQLSAQHNAAARLTIHFHFNGFPQAINATTNATTNAPTNATTASKQVCFTSPTNSGGSLQLRADSVISAIGFAPDPTRDFDCQALAGEQADLASGKLADGLYCAGWLKRGPRGTIAENRLDAKRLAQTIYEQFSALTMRAEPKPGYQGVQAQLGRYTDFAGWQRIDAWEQMHAPAQRERRKLTDFSQMVNIAQGMDTGE